MFDDKFLSKEYMTPKNYGKKIRKFAKKIPFVYGLLVINSRFNNILGIMWSSVLFMEEKMAIKALKWLLCSAGLSIFFMSTSISLFTGGTFFLNLNNIYEYLIQNCLKSRGTKDHFSQVKVSWYCFLLKGLVLVLLNQILYLFTCLHTFYIMHY